MNRTEPKPPQGKYHQAKLTAPLGPLMPAGKIGWLSADVETIDADGKPMFRFISATNHDLVFKVYAEEVIIE